MHRFKDCFFVSTTMCKGNRIQLIRIYIFSAEKKHAIVLSCSSLGFVSSALKENINKPLPFLIKLKYAKCRFVDTDEASTEKVTNYFFHIPEIDRER